MSDIAIQVENLGKLYRLGEVGTGTLGQDLNRWWARVRGKEDPFAVVGETNDRTSKGTSDFVWSLKDVNFEVKKGEVLGIIGRNGAGKSTLLKILSKVTAPTTGKIKIQGRIASLLEVGTGFHPDLTGRENIFLNGAILGMSKTEIRSKFDEIVDFSGVERYIDTPVKRYSSGMYVRLAFAVAAFLEPEILIIDEVLAVGDAEFQKKCLGRMKDVSVNDGRTVLFVSHNLHAIMSLCDTGIYLKNGTPVLIDTIDSIVKSYSNEQGSNFSRNIEIYSKGKRAWLTDFKFISADEKSNSPRMNEPARIEVMVEAIEDIKDVFIGIGINDLNGLRVFTLFSRFYNKTYDLFQGENNILCMIDNLILKPGIYNVEIYVGNDHVKLDYYDHGLQIEIFPSGRNYSSLPDSSQGSVLVEQKWV
ncbi:ABC transporter ATP-binding protein [Hymenobacter jejuensis]|uniref:ABC transporter ATP-binding protein n=1 Tax=Hymenobacter jejuensis TaxID=2502781 RepID=A0A5B7ZXX5_9BACT|nr:ABC transporter ATP-binding protein [Hymenobacter jejuensis]QDA59356.1 ABC transporter ATP-binding protein [Hymenobacter jejuensis]